MSDVKTIAEIDEAMIILGDLTDRELLNHIVKEIAELRTSHNRILELVDSIANEVKPTLDALRESPILRMMGVTKNA